MNYFKQCIQNLCQYVRLTSTQNGKDAQVYEGQSLGQSLKMRAVMPWGISCRPPTGTQLLRWSTNGQKNNSAAMAFDSSTRFDDIEEGEIVFGNQTTRAKVYMTNEGGINIETPEGSINVNTGDGGLFMTINGSININATGSATINSEDALTLSSSTAVNILSQTLTHNNINVGATHQHPNGNNGNSTGTPF